MKRITLPIVLLFTMTMGVFAQTDDSKKNEGKSGYNFGVLPAISYNTDLGFQYGVLTNIYDYGDGSLYPKYKHSLYAEVSRFTKGSGIFRVFYDSEFLVSNIRLTADMTYYTQQALQFYGFNGYDAYYNSDYTNEDSPDYLSRLFYNHQRNTFRFKLDLQGKIVGDLGWVAGYSFINTKIDDVPVDKLNKGKDEEDMLQDTSLYKNYVEWGVISEEEKDGGFQNCVKLGLVYDTRDNEACPMKGIWTELVMLNCLGNESNFGKLSFTHRQYFTLIENDLSFAYRVGYQGKMWGDMPFYMAPYMFYSYMPSLSFDGLGGSKTVRGMSLNRLVAESMAYANIELRWKFAYFKFINQQWYAALSPFVDLGRTISKMEVNTEGVPDDEYDNYFKDDAEELHITYGTGLHVAMNHNFVITADLGLPVNKQDGNMGFYIGMNWMF